MLHEDSIDLQNTAKITGRISSCRVSKDFSFTLGGSPIVYNIYRPNRNYDDLQAILAIGDSVTVYTISSATANLQVGQLEKAGRVIVGKQLLESQNKTGGIIALLGGIGMIWAGIWQFRRSK